MLLLVIPAGLLVWLLFFRTTPLQAFEKEMRSHVEVLNGYRHARLKPLASPGLQDRLREDGLDLDRAVLWAHRRDLNQQVQYRFESAFFFQAGDYAEARFLRSGPGGDFAAAREFHLPWIYREGTWQVAPGFRDGRVWDYPR